MWPRPPCRAISRVAGLTCPLPLRLSWRATASLGRFSLSGPAGGARREGAGGSVRRDGGHAAGAGRCPRGSGAATPSAARGVVCALRQSLTGQRAILGRRRRAESCKREQTISQVKQHPGFCQQEKREDAYLKITEFPGRGGPGVAWRGPPHRAMQTVSMFVQFQGLRSSCMLCVCIRCHGMLLYFMCSGYVAVCPLCVLLVCSYMPVSEVVGSGGVDLPVCLSCRFCNLNWCYVS